MIEETEICENCGHDKFFEERIQQPGRLEKYQRSQETHQKAWVEMWLAVYIYRCAKCSAKLNDVIGA